MTAPEKNKIILDKEAQEIREKLIEVASQRKIFTYSDLVNDDNDRHMNKLSKTLAKVSYFERHEDKPFLYAIVVQKDSNTPGVGFLRFVMIWELIQILRCYRRNVLSIGKNSFKKSINLYYSSENYNYTKLNYKK